MKRLLSIAGIAIATVALSAVFVRAAALQPEAIDLLAISPDAMPTSSTFATLHQKVLVVTDGMTAALSVGTAPKHYHAGANEVQLILDGTGTEWLGEQQVALKPGMLVIIPAGTAHAGITDTSSGKLRLVAFKTPPQSPDDYHAAPVKAAIDTGALQATTIDLLAMTTDAMGPPPAAFPNLHSKTLVVAPGMTLALQEGTAPKHYHANANEIQVVLRGTGTEWLGDKQVDVKPGTMVVIPMGTTHAGLVQTGSTPLRFISIKTPPQAPTDIHPVQ